MSEEICFSSARALAEKIRRRELSAREVMAAHLARIHQINPTLNAIVALQPDEECLALADRADAALARGDAVGPLHGLPIAFKDMQQAVGFPCTQGSPIYADHQPAADSVLVARLKHAGALPIGKTNVPEFAMGSHTYNRVYGTTTNPYDHTKSAGGSSGGAAAALATGMLPIADGSDLGGSLRNPANFNNVVAIRPSHGLVPTMPAAFPLLGFSVNGPLARSTADVAWLLSVMAGVHPDDPGTLPIDGDAFARPLDRDFRGTRVAWCPDLGGLPLDPAVRRVLEEQRAVLAALGCDVEEACPAFDDVDDVFRVIRAFRTAATLGPLLAVHRDQLKPEAIWEIELGQRLTAADVAHAMMRHGALLERMRQFERRYEFLICAVNQVPPFAATTTWPRAIDGVDMPDYISWMRSAYWISTTFRPAMSVPAGFTADGLPVGIQMVGRYRDDWGVLQLGHAFEGINASGRRRPPALG